MDDSEYENIFRHEQTHFFYLSIREILFDLLNRELSGRHGLEILDAGCGTGGFSRFLKKFGNVVGVDTSDKALEYSRKTGLECQRASIESLPFNAQSFDAITCVDVLYHKNVSSELDALREFFRVLKPEGLLALRVPAFECLYSQHDVVVQTRRRYTASDLRELLHEAGFTIEKLSYCHCSLFIPALVKAKFSSSRSQDPRSGVNSASGMLNHLLTELLRFENALIRTGLDMPFGLGIIAIAKKLL